MDVVNIQSLIEAGQVINLPGDVDATSTFVQVGVYQIGNRRRGASNANAYTPAVIPLSLLIGGGGIVTGVNNGLTLNLGVVQLGGLLIQPTTITGTSANFLDIQDSFGSFVKTRDANSNFSIADFGGNTVDPGATNIFSYLSTLNSYDAGTSIVLNFGSLGTYINATDTWNFGDNSQYSNTTQSFVLGRGNVLVDTVQVSVFGNYNDISTSTSLTVIGEGNVITDDNIFYIGNNNNNLTVDGTNGRLVSLYPPSALPYGVWGHTFAAPTNGANDNAFNVGTSGLAQSLFALYNNGAFEIGHLASPVAKLSFNGVDTFFFGGGFDVSVGINTTSPLAKLHVSGPGASTTILGSIIDNLGGWFHTVTVGSGNGLLFLEAGASTGDVTAFRVGVTGGATGGNFSIYDNTGSSKVVLSGAVGASRVYLTTDAGAPAFEVTNIGDAIFSNEVAMPGLQTGNAGLVTGDLYVDTAANVLANGDRVLAWKV